jgi:hypothetical protein
MLRYVAESFQSSGGIRSGVFPKLRISKLTRSIGMLRYVAESFQSSVGIRSGVFPKLRMYQLTRSIGMLRYVAESFQSSANHNPVIPEFSTSWSGTEDCRKYPESSIGTHVPISSAKLYHFQMRHPLLGWQIEFATKAEGLSLKAASLLLPNRSLADQSLAPQSECVRMGMTRSTRMLRYVAEFGRPESGSQQIGQHKGIRVQYVAEFGRPESGSPLWAKEHSEGAQRSGAPRTKAVSLSWSPLWATQFIPWVLTYQCKELYFYPSIHQIKN